MQTKSDAERKMQRAASSPLWPTLSAPLGWISRVTRHMCLEDNLANDSPRLIFCSCVLHPSDKKCAGQSICIERDADKQGGHYFLFPSPEVCALLRRAAVLVTLIIPLPKNSLRTPIPVPLFRGVCPPASCCCPRDPHALNFKDFSTRLFSVSHILTAG